MVTRKQRPFIPCPQCRYAQNGVCLARPVTAAEGAKLVGIALAVKGKWFLLASHGCDDLGELTLAKNGSAAAGAARSE